MPHIEEDRALTFARRRGISPLVQRLGQRAFEKGIPAGSAFGPGGTLEGLIPPDDGDDGRRDPTGVGGRTLTFAQTEAGQRLLANLGLETERASGRERLRLEDTLHSLAVDLLPPENVEDAMENVRSGRVVKSKLAFQAVLQNLSDAAQNAERRRDLDLQEENERRN
ncbi:hypothetical protein LCGC14_2233170 [marine sediment metagenome]|uniref:Uncharacterized protein n=1 Tax=marine sediment metagenome TaxID=412755 RepID=A0A0F9DV84_9ZZZZ